MIDTAVLQPPCAGPLSNPLLFGIASGLAALLPPIERTVLSVDIRASGAEDGGAEPEAMARAA